MTVIAQGSVPPIATVPLWQWDTSGPVATVSGFPNGLGTGYNPTKTGLTPTDLQQYIGVPIQYYGDPPSAVPSGVIQQWIRFAEDRVEQETSILLCQTWVASPPALSPQIANAVGVIPNTNSGAQIRGYDYDLEDNAYDFVFNRAQDEGWMYQTLRYRPVQSLTYAASGSAATASITAIKNVAYVYPLLSVFFHMPSQWFVEDKDFGLVRFVPAANVQMLPLFAMQLAFMGFSESVPGAVWMQYCAGLTGYDYQSRYSFMKELVLAEAALTALNTVQGTINLGAESYSTTVDGLQQQIKYYASGPFGPLILNFAKRRDYLMSIARSKVSGPMVNVL